MPLPRAHACASDAAGDWHPHAARSKGACICLLPQGAPLPLTQAVAEQSQLPALQVIGGGTPSPPPAQLISQPGANPNPQAQLLATPNTNAGSQLPGFPAAQPNKLLWVGLGGNSGNSNSGNSR